MHTTGAHEISSKSRYSITFALQTKMNAILDEEGGGGGGGDIRGGDTNIGNMMAAIMGQCTVMEKEDIDPDTAAFADQAADFLKSFMAKFKKRLGQLLSTG